MLANRPSSATPVTNQWIAPRPDTARSVSDKGAVDPASVEQNAYLLVEGLPERIPLKILTGKVREQILKSQGRYGYGDGEDSQPKPERMIVVQSSRTLAVKSCKPSPAIQRHQQA